MKHRCDGNSCMDKIMIHYHFKNPKIDKTANILFILNCHFINNYRKDQVLHVEVEKSYYGEVHIHLQSVAIQNYCRFFLQQIYQAFISNMLQ